MTEPTTTTTPAYDNTTNLYPVIDSKCSIYSNTTGFIIKEYQGIPENLIVNLGVWFILIILFTFLRRIGDYGRFGLLKKDEERRNEEDVPILNPFNRLYSWNTRLFGYWSLDDASINSANDNDNQSRPTPAANADRANTQSPNTSTSSADSSTPMQATTSAASAAAQPSGKYSEYNDKYFFSWIINMYKLKDKHIEEKCGKDAINYLTFQRYLIVYLLIVTILSISILLPINFSGSSISDNKVFGSTTIVNVRPDSPILWVHLTLSWLFLIMGFVFMRIFSKRMAYTEADYVSRTVLILNLPFYKCEKELIIRHFNEAYPGLVVTDIQFAYDISKLSKLDQRKRAMHIGKVTSQKIFEKTNKRPMMHPFHFGSFIELCCCCLSEPCFKNNKNRRTDAIDYYTKNESDLKQRIIEARHESFKKPLGILFVTFQNQKMAAEFLKDYNFGVFGRFLMKCFHEHANSPTSCYLCHFPKSSRLSGELKAAKWSVKYAPAPSNIKWENISRLSSMWYFRIILINMLLTIVMIFFTTPAIFLEKLTEWASFLKFNTIENSIPPFLQEFLPSMLLRILAALLPVLVAWTSLAELHWTRSSENKSMMIKTFTLLLFMVLILPTLGLTSINAIFQWLNKNEISFKWRCVSDNGAFFLKYVTTCSFIGTALDLLRLPDLFYYLIKLFWSRSLAERLNCRLQAAFEFDYGIQYAWLLTVFTITLSFSVVCPLITPFGLVYLVLKHSVDRYNIFFAYVFTKINKNIHKTAVTFTIAAFLILQFCILFFIAVRNKGDNDAMSVVQIIVVTFSCIIFFGRLFFGIFKRFSPFKKKFPGDDDVANGTGGAGAESDANSPDGKDDDGNTVKVDTDGNIINSDNDAEMIGETDQEQEETGDAVQTQQPTTSVLSGVPRGSISNILEEDIRPFSTNPKLRLAKGSNNAEIQSPFVPGLLRSSSPVLKLKLDNATGAETDTDASIININEPPQQRNLSPLPLEPGHIEIDVGSRATSPTHSRLHYGALNKAVNVFFKKSTNEDGADPNSDKVKINKAFNDEFNGGQS